MTTILHNGAPYQADIRFYQCQIEGCTEPVAPGDLEWWRVGSARFCMHHYIEYLRFCVEVRRGHRAAARRARLAVLDVRARAMRRGRGEQQP